MKKYVLCLCVLLILTCFASACMGQEQETTLNVFGAVSLSECLNEIAQSYEESHHTKVFLNFAGSGTLKNQIEQGADCDIFISASEEDMDLLEEQDIIEGESRHNLLGNTLILIASREAKAHVSLKSLKEARIDSLAIGTPESVPAGRYAMQTLEYFGIKEEIEPKLIGAKDVRSVLDYVETGNAECGMVYKTDGMWLNSAVEVAQIPEECHDPIIYPVGVVRESKNKEGVAEFYDFLKGDYAKEIFEEYGFTVL